MILLKFYLPKWGDARGILGQIETDLANGTELVYFLPDLLISVQDFKDNIKIVLKTKGYETWISGESNLLVTKGIVARITNTSYTAFRYNSENIMDY